MIIHPGKAVLVACRKGLPGVLLAASRKGLPGVLLAASLAESVPAAFELNIEKADIVHARTARCFDPPLLPGCRGNPGVATGGLPDSLLPQSGLQAAAV